MARATMQAPAPIRSLSVGVTERGVVVVAFGRGGGRRLEVAARRLGAEVSHDRALTDPVAAQLAEYLAGERRSFDLPIDWSLTSGEQHAVLATLHSTVGYGQATTYGELALRSRAGGGARGVGSIMGSNPVPLIVACHRVLAAGGLGGFGGGLEVKRWLLALEGVLPAALGFDAIA